MSSRPPLRNPLSPWLIGFVLLVLLVVLLDWAVELLWFDALGYAAVFWTLRLLKTGLFLSAFALVFGYLWANARAIGRNVGWGPVGRALRQTGHPRQMKPESPDDHEATGTPGGAMPAVVVISVLAVAAVFALALAGQWTTLLRFVWAEEYGEVDPIFGHDIGWYLFTVPFLELVQNTVITAAALVVLAILWIYFTTRTIGLGPRFTIRAPPSVLAHVGVNLSVLFLATAAGYFLDRYALLQSSGGAVYGAGFTEVRVELPILWIMVAFTSALAVGVFIPAIRRRGRILVAAAGAYLLSWFVLLGIVPWVAQSFVVEPNELALETPYLRHNIALTREAFGLEHIDERSYEGMTGLMPAALERNRATIDNIRLWDWRPLSQTFRQLQRIRTYYEFGDVDVDRYEVDGQYAQVMLGVRELAGRLPGKADRWLNRRMQYTHGYGLAMSLTAKKNPQGSPLLVVSDLPPRSAPGLTLAQPAVYYGEEESGYRIVNTTVKEFDYPRGDDNVYSHYQGKGGVALDASWKKLLFAWDRFDANLLISAYPTRDSRIQLWRGVGERVEQIAPFLEPDADPYPVVSNGRLFWIQDLYTQAETFPYSEPYEGDFNYIRNSVKAVVDAYHGTVTFYVVDERDPVLRVMRGAMPTLFSPLSSMPQDLKRHLRYPADLFKAQVAKYSTYHMTVPQVFYNGEDLWAVPREKYGGEVIRMAPYFVLMKLPGEHRLEFLLMTPLTPSNRDNMIAWVAARCDFPGYGELLVFKLPKERLILGPMQVEATIDQDTLVSQQLSLWDQRGSRVIRGNLLVIPIEDSFVYVEPVYLIAEDSDIPQLKRVIVSDGERLAMEPTLEASLASVFGDVLPTAPTIRTTGSGVDSAELREARSALKAAQEALRAGEWAAFGRAFEHLQHLLEE